MFSPLRLRVVVSYLLALTLLAVVSHAQNVTTWHNDNNRTGWQPNETSLTADSTQPGYVIEGNFGLLYQWAVVGDVRAQPLAVANVQTGYPNCSPSCNLVFVATEQDLLYAFNATSPSNTPVWSVDLAARLGGDCGGLFGFDPAAHPLQYRRSGQPRQPGW
jgi:hypothetical protein